MADVSVRPARSDDVDEIARIQISTWATAYERLLPPDALAAATPEWAREQWAAAVIEPPSPRHRVLVALHEDQRVGFTAFAPGERAMEAEILTMLVEPRWGRRGHGSRLLAATMDHLRDDGAKTVAMWLLDRDVATKEFLTAAGWAPSGTARTLDTGGGEIREIEMHTSLTEDLIS